MKIELTEDAKVLVDNTPVLSNVSITTVPEKKKSRLKCDVVLADSVQSLDIMVIQTTNVNFNVGLTPNVSMDVFCVNMNTRKPIQIHITASMKGFTISGYKSGMPLKPVKIEKGFTSNDLQQIVNYFI